MWLYALMGYADALGKLDELFKTPEVYYYAHYFLNLMSPASVVPDFGDAALDPELAALLRVLRGGGGPAQRPGDGLGRAADRGEVHRLLDPEQRRAGVLPPRQLPLGPRRHPAGRADGAERRGDGGRPGQEDRLPQRLGALVDLPAAELPRRGRRRHELPRLPARLDPGRGREDDARPRRREQHRPADVGRVGAAARRRRTATTCRAARSARYRQDYFHNRLCHPAREDLHGPEQGRRALQHQGGRPGAAPARVPAQRRLLPSDPDAQGGFPVAARVRLQPDPADRRRMGL
ncbi:MAG: hypothetical protein MZV64_43110 [Ignavibacteriales bacterium]|nr:hypothetical protein [Ignavibacteriales bacterium]